MLFQFIIDQIHEFMLVFDGVHLRQGYKDLKIIFFNVGGGKFTVPFILLFEFIFVSVPKVVCSWTTL